jgi:hypothetical protein
VALQKVSALLNPGPLKSGRLSLGSVQVTPAEYAATTKAKRAGKAAGKQFVAQPKSVKAKVKPYRKVK